MSTKNYKWLHVFNNTKEVEVTKEEKSKDSEGNEVTTSKLVKEEKTISVGIRKPTRRMHDDGELFHGVELSKAIKAGMMTVNLLRKRYVNDGGYMADDEKNEYAMLYLETTQKENELQKLRVNLEALSEEEKEDSVTKVTLEIADLKRRMFDFETQRNQLFEQTAEARARNKAIMWWVLFLAYTREGEEEEWKPLFNGDTYDEKYESYDELQNLGDPFFDEVSQQLAYYISFWYNGQLSEPEDFSRAGELIKTSIEADKAEQELSAREKEEMAENIKKGLAKLEAEEQAELAAEAKEEVKPEND